MKKLLIILLCLLFMGCESKTATSLDVDAACKDLDTKYTNMYEMDSNELFAIYGLEVEKCEKYIIKSSSLSNGNFYAILKVNSENKNEIKGQMSDMFDILEKQSNLYSPKAVELIKNRLETSVGDYLIYLIGEDTNALYELVKAHIN